VDAGRSPERRIAQAENILRTEFLGKIVNKKNNMFL
jgi:hypothetical protein